MDIDWQAHREALQQKVKDMNSYLENIARTWGDECEIRLRSRDVDVERREADGEVSTQRAPRIEVKVWVRMA